MDENIKITNQPDSEVNKNKKTQVAIFSWCYFLISLIVSMFVPEVREFSNLGILGIFKRAIFSNYQMTLIVFGIWIFIFVLMYFIDFLRIKFLKNYSPPPDKTLKELEGGLRGLWIIAESWRLYAVIIGTIILIASIFRISLSFY
jgi:ABC-type multidrug transport system fused ATPase/permease subunit